MSLCTLGGIKVASKGPFVILDCPQFRKLDIPSSIDSSIPIFTTRQVKYWGQWGTGLDSLKAPLTHPNVHIGIRLGMARKVG